ncbi:hypothetical protein T261_08357 [Streptomyces lydicus]|nr:hypothetical protein T261_08357 [Streptomyces lydicus]
MTLPRGTAEALHSGRVPGVGGGHQQSLRRSSGDSDGQLVDRWVRH